MKKFSIALALAALAVYPIRADRGGIGSARLQLVEATVADIQKAAQTGLASTADIVHAYLTRIAAYDKTGPHLNAYLTLNPNAAAQARAEDAERHHGRARLPLDGIPIILKDNVDTRDMQTSAGSVALTGSVPPDDATITRKLRKAGAIIMGKATLTEFANFLTNGMPAGYSSLGGYGFNPFDPRPDPRPGVDSFGRPFADGRQALSPGGSSSGPGIAVSANLATVGIGTETSGSILSPGTQNLLVGIKPTVGLVSRDGIIPISADQDTAGPLARTVTDAAKVLGVIAGYDPADPATAACLTPGNCHSDYTRFLDRHALAGKRIAVPQTPYVSGLTPSQLQVMNDAIAVLRELGATVDPVEIPTQTALNAFGGCGVHGQANCSTVLLYGFKRDLNAYLATLNASSPSHSLADVIAYNSSHPGATKYGQDLAIQSQLFDTTPGSSDTIRYQQDRALDLQLSRGGLDAIYASYDAILFPANRGANIAARAGYPSIVVPGGFVANAPTPPFPAGFNALPAPYGVTFSGPAFSEAKLIGFAYAFEQATHHRVAPASAPPLPSDSFGRR
ncbi:MAG TPA: amidase family protein [Vicinamibacterales bacterium]|nr:amidase family protein [Vicinamibacterales bacterium]